MKNSNNNGFYNQLEGFYKVSVIDKSDNIVWEQPDWKKNLILNNGMDQLYNMAITNCFTYAISGTGTRVNSISSGGSNGSVAGTTFTLIGGGTLTDLTAAGGGYASQAQAGDMIKFSGGSEVRIVSVTNATTAVVTPSSTIGSSTFTIWKTSQADLEVEVQRTNNYLTGVQYCSSSFSGSTGAHKRTWDFPLEVGTVNYTEVGVGWSASPPNTTFSRILLGSPVTVNSGQKLRIIYELDATYSPNTPTSFSAVVNTWPVAPSTSTSGSLIIQQLSSSVGYFVSYVDNNGLTQGFSFLEPNSTNAGYFLSDVSTSLAPFGSAFDRSSGSAWNTTSTKASYVANSFTCDKTVAFSGGSFTSTNLRSMGFGSGSAASASNQAFVMLFDQNQTKTSIQSLTLSYRWTWSRILA